MQSDITSLINDPVSSSPGDAPAQERNRQNVDRVVQALMPSSETESHARAQVKEPATILFVEDHADTRRVVQLSLQRQGYRVLTADCVAAAMEMIGSSRFDLLLSDIGLPDGTGHEIMRSVREKGKVPGIALSGFGMEEDIKSSLDAGFLTHLVKPVRSVLLFATIAGAIAHRAE